MAILLNLVKSDRSRIIEQIQENTNKIVRPRHYDTKEKLEH